MPYNIHYNHVRAREQSPSGYESSEFSSRPHLLRRNSKRQRLDIYSSDDEYDDYPKSSSALAVIKPRPTKTSRALTIRQPSQLEKYNVFNTKSSQGHHHHHNHDAHDHHHDSHHKAKKVTKYYITRPCDSDDDDKDEREFRLKIKATLSRPKKEEKRLCVWPGSLLKKEKWECVDWESWERERECESDGCHQWWDDECVGEREREVRYRRVKRSRTEEWKPLSGLRRF